MNFYKHHIGDYAQATAHLSFAEDGAYSRLIRKYYAEEKPLPADLKTVQRLAGARTREEREAIETVLNEFFVLQADGWHNKRCDAEIEKANAQAESNRRVAVEREARRKSRQSSNEVATNQEQIVQRQEHDSSHDSLNDSSRSREPSQTPDSRLQTPDKSKSPPGGAVHLATPANPEPDRTAPAPVVLSRHEQFQRMRGAPVSVIPPDWQPSEAVRMRLVTAGCRQMAADDIARFVGHFTATAEMLADWDARAVNWMLDQRRFDQRDQQRNGGPALSEAEKDRAFAEAVADVERREQRIQAEERARGQR